MKYKPTRYFDNARLAVELAIELGAKGTSAGTMSGFSDTPPDWKCPGCQRDKAGIARLNKHAEFYCAIHLHHDHSGEQVVEDLGITWFRASETLRQRVDAQARFLCTKVCMLQSHRCSGEEAGRRADAFQLLRRGDRLVHRLVLSQIPQDRRPEDRARLPAGASRSP